MSSEREVTVLSAPHRGKGNQSLSGEIPIVDLHTHLIPGLDDGVRSLQDAVQAVRQAMAFGVEAIVVTPHQRPGLFDVTAEEIVDGVATLNRRLEHASIDLALYAGAEIHVQEDLVEKVRRGELLTINRTGRYILLELPYVHLPEGLDDLIFTLKAEDIQPIIAHPERNRGFLQHPERLYELIRLGAYSQVTAASLVARDNSELARFCLNLIRHRLCHLVASDSHGHGERAKRLPEARTLLSARFPEEVVRLLLKTNPQKIVRGEDLLVDPPEIWRPRSRFFGLLK